MTRAVKVEAAFIGVLMVVAVGQQVWIQSRPEPRKGLDYPEQKVISQVADNRRGTYLEGHLTVRGTKCNQSDAPIGVTGVTSWVSADPPGTVIQDGTGSAIRRPGCDTRTYVNPIPAEVIAATRDLIDSSGSPCVTWRITGRETPADHLILPEVWETEQFELCP